MKKWHWNKMSTAEIGAAICSHLEQQGIKVVLSGGACVEIYSNNQYVSKDLDFVMPDYPLKRIDPIMQELGFKRMSGGRYYENTNCPYSVEFPPSPLSVGNELVAKTSILKNKFGRLRLLRPVDSVKDRLAAFYHWRDRQSLEQAIMICCKRRIDMEEVKAWSRSEGAKEQFKLFFKMLKAARVS